MRRTESTEQPGASTAHETFGFDREKSEQEPVVTLRGKVSVGEADRANTESSAVKGQSDEDVRRKDMRDETDRVDRSAWGIYCL